jgi:AcrR family transcriptional regulator
VDDDRATRDRILDAAERLLAERGSTAMSIRDVLKAAEVANAGAIGYYFGGKDGLVSAVERRAVADINQARLAALEATGQHPSAYDLALAFIGPLARLRAHPRGQVTSRVYARIFDEPQSQWPRNGADEVFAVTQVYMTATRPLLPEADDMELLWRWQSVTAMCFWYVTGYLDVFSTPGPDDVDDDITALAAQSGAVLTTPLPAAPARRVAHRDTGISEG